MKIQILKVPKVCSCKAMHYVATDPKKNETGTYWLCKCGNTLFVADEAYLELQRTRSKAKAWVKQAKGELAIS